LNLAVVRTAWVGEGNDKYKLTILQVGQSKYYKRHNSGYSQSAAIAAMSAKLLKPDIVISFGTAGGTIGKVNIGDVLLGEGCVFIDRIRSSSKNSFDWGIYGGPTMFCPSINSSEFKISRGIVGSQVNYSVSPVQVELINMLGVAGLDMEAASESQILLQTETNFIALKAISNFIYPGEPMKMEEEYVVHKAEVSIKSLIFLEKFFNHLIGKNVGNI